MLVFGKNDSRRLSNFLQSHIFWKFDRIFRTCNEITYRNIWFAKVIIILIMMTQVLFSDIFFSKKTRLLIPLRIDFSNFHDFWRFYFRFSLGKLPSITIFMSMRCSLEYNMLNHIVSCHYKNHTEIYRSNGNKQSIWYKICDNTVATTYMFC